MKKLLVIILTAIMGTSFLCVPGVAYGTEEATDEQPQSVEQMQREQVVAAAQSQEGYLKGEGEDIYTLEAKKLGYSAHSGWCGRFVWWCFFTTNNASAYNNGMYTGSPTRMLEWASDNDLLVDKSEAQPGDIMIKIYSQQSPHAGIIESIDEDGTIHTIERNHYKRDDGVYRFTRPYADYFISPQYGE